MTFAATRTGSVPAPYQPAACWEASTDETLIERIAKADHLAMRTLFARHQTRVYRFVLRLVRNEATAEDVLSDVFLDVWRTASQFQARSAVSTWLLAIARFKALSVIGVELNKSSRPILLICYQIRQTIQRWHFSTNARPKCSKRGWLNYQRRTQKLSI